MTFDPAKPRYTLPFAGKDYELEGTFGLLEAVEQALQDSIVRIAVRVVEMPVSETAKLMATLLGFHGHRITPQDIGRILVDEMGLSGQDYAVLKLHLYACLKVFLSPPASREEVANNMGELVGKWSSRGETTDASV